VIAALCVAGFRFPSGEGRVLLVVRRHHDTAAAADNKAFSFSRTVPSVGATSFREFGTYREARRYFDTEVRALEDTGMVRESWEIQGFHEEG